ncbi:MAG: hypothetical protein MK171_12825 [Pirellulales bacterium]|nr:hypothetical protein [Pirellulales bacterium]
MRVCLVLVVVLVIGTGPSVSSVAFEPPIQKSIARVEQMPNMPAPYAMRNWKQVAKDYDALVFDFARTGENLPLVWWDPRRLDLPVKTFALPSFVGHYVKADNHYDTITCLGAVYGAALVGIDKSDQQGRNWAAMCTNYFNPVEHERLYLNNISASTGGSFWYELFPSILFYRVFEAYPDTPGMAEHFTITADRWVEASEGMGGKTTPWTVPDFNHTAYNFATGKPFDNDLWKEAGSAAAIGWIEYLAYTQTKNEKYLTAARWGMEYLDGAQHNPFYEVLFPHGVYTAARMNAELGTNYDVEKLINWCFDGDNSRGWGVSAGRWGDYDCSGLSSSIHAGNDQHGYAFAMNTLNLADSLVPIPRYDDRYARTVGKWMLNAANSMRLFYANGLPADQQTDYNWAQKHDPTACLAYEGLRSSNISLSRISEDYKTVAGTVKSGSFADTLFTNRVYQQLEESETSRAGSGDGDSLVHLWRAEVGSAIECEIHVVAKSTGDEAFQLSYAIDPAGPFEELALVDSKDNAGFSKQIFPKGPHLYLKAEDAGTAAGLDESGTASPGTLFVDDVWIVMKQGSGPVATGDAKDSGWADTNFGIYGSSFVGIYGAIINTTNVQGILQLDCLATDHYHALAYPTYLYYNPHAKQMRVEIDLGPKQHPQDLYDAVTDEFLERNVSGLTSFDIDPDSARLLVVVPADGVAVHRDHRLFVDNVVVDYNYKAFVAKSGDVE